MKTTYLLLGVLPALCLGGCPGSVQGPGSDDAGVSEDLSAWLPLDALVGGGPDLAPRPCANDMDCANDEYCTSDLACAKLPTPGRVPCMGGTQVTSMCNMAKTPADLVACAGKPASTACPYCRDASCYWPVSWTGGACTSDRDCHGGDYCQNGGCIVDTRNGKDPCPRTVALLDIIKGKYGSGKEVCIRDVIVKTVAEDDGDIHVRIGNVQYPGETFVGFITEPTPQYLSLGTIQIPDLTPPDGAVIPDGGWLGPTVRLHGMVRWDQGHMWWEMHPVDWIGP